MNDRDFTDMMKGLAITFVFFHHWFGWLPRPTGSFLSIVNNGAVFAGTFVQLFFVLSGYGLMKSMIGKSAQDWRQWYAKRMSTLLVPFLIITTVMFFLARWAACIFSISDRNLSFGTLVLHLSLLRNFFPASQGFNDSLWFIPVIFGLYIVFPLLLYVLRRNDRIFLLVSAGLSFGSLWVFSLAGLPTGHFEAFFGFHILQFSIGMYLAHRQISVRSCTKCSWLAVGCGCYALSVFLMRYCSRFRDWNDALNAIGALAVSACLCQVVSKISITNGFFIFVGKYSYTLYLLHGVCILYFAKPLFDEALCCASGFLLAGGVLFGVLVGIAPFISRGVWGVWRKGSACLARLHKL